MVPKILLLILAYGITFFIQQAIRNMLIESGKTAANYKGENIPGTMGVAVILGSILTFSVCFLFEILKTNKMIFTNKMLYIGFWGLVTAFIGIIDDVYGNNQWKGFKGHLKNLFHVKLTTGGLKAVVGMLTAFMISIQLSNNIYVLLVNIFLISLTTNLINLLDVRPGRAIKGFLILIFTIFLAGNVLSISYIVLGAVLAYFPLDLKAKGMLGDTGANFIGMIGSVNLIIAVENIKLKIIILFLVFILNLLSERISLSKLIEKNRFLNFIDQLGRQE